MDLGKIIQAAAGVHALLGVGWLGLSLYGATLKPPLAPGLRKGQAVLAVLVAFVGLVLWRYKHAGAPGAAEAWLGVGVLLAIAAAGLQHGMAKANERRLRALGAEPGGAGASLLKKIQLADRLAALLLAAALAAMLVGSRMV